MKTIITIVLFIASAVGATTDADLTKTMQDIDSVSNALAQTQARLAQARLDVETLPKQAEVLSNMLNAQVEGLKKMCTDLKKVYSPDVRKTVGGLTFTQVGCVDGPNTPAKPTNLPSSKPVDASDKPK